MSDTENRRTTLDPIKTEYILARLDVRLESLEKSISEKFEGNEKYNKMQFEHIIALTSNLQERFEMIMNNHIKDNEEANEVLVNDIARVNDEVTKLEKRIKDIEEKPKAAFNKWWTIILSAILGGGGIQAIVAIIQYIASLPK